MQRWSRSFVFISCLLVSGCSSTFKAYQETLQLAVTTPDDIVLSVDDLAKRQTKALYIRRDHGQQLVLASVDNLLQQQIYRSLDEGSLRFDQGRLVAAQGFELDLQHTYPSRYQQLPAISSALKVGSSYSAQQAWSNPLYSGHVIQYRVTAKESELLDIQGWSFQTIRIDEQATAADGQTWLNQYWLDSETNIVLKSIQQPAPFWYRLECTFISDAYGLAKARGLL